jgi:glycosyl transferase family 87
VTTWRFFAGSRPLQVAVLAVFLAGWGLHAFRTYNDPELGGLFRWIGVDFGFFYAHAQVFAHGDMASLYSVEAAAPYRDALAIYSSSPGVAMPSGPVPFPPIYAWLISPMALVPAPLAFAIWTVINAVAALVLSWRAASFFPPERRLLSGGLVLVSTAVMFSLWFGQPQLFLALAFGEAFIAFRKGRDMTAGLWLALIVFKPQYLVLIVPIMLWKRRWKAFAGFVAGGLVILVASILVAGPATFGSYIGSLIASATASGGALLTAVSPYVMVNWRALVLALPLDLPDAARVAITLVLSGLTVLAVVIAWRGPWLPSGPRFAGQMTLLGIGTIVTAWHSHIHGVAMIAVPLAAFLASGLGRETIDRAIGVAIRLIVGAAVLAPWLWFAVLNRSHTEANKMVTIALVTGFVLLFALLLRREPSPAEAPLASQAAPV